ncbi:carbohydrate-binding domain-containing protein [Hamadaea sp. NPDC051192]|uniref:carbohydrate-binding domain-containing protein n=1 Tax=Hamadaea sp. NPDC051192 TaxID=3154940 RepID=UPI003415B44C
MKIRRKALVAVTSAALGIAALAGCSTSADPDTSTAASTAGTSTVSGSQTAQEVMAANQADHVDGDQSAFTESEVVDVKLSGGSASADGDGVKVDGSTVTITQGGTYRLSGSLTGQVVVAAADATVKLILDDATITSSTTAAIAVTDAKLVTVVLAEGSQNSLADTSSYAEDADVNAALFSSADLTITGAGALTVHGNGNDGIASKDGLVIQAGTISVTAKDDGVRGKDYLVVDGGTVTVAGGGDGLKADNDTDADRGYISVTGGTVKVTAGGDGADASTDLVVTGGTLTVATGGGSGEQPSDDTSAKGLKSNVITVLDGGTITADSADDAVHSDGAVHFAGATVTLASGDDGVHAEGDLIVDKGTVTVTKSNEGLEGKDITVNGGDVTVTSSDDGINAAGGSGTSQSGGGGFGRGGGGGGEMGVGDYSLTIAGGTVVVNADGDGFDSNGTAKITGGTLVVNGPTMDGNGALDVNGSFEISGGVLVAAGSAGMAVAPDTGSAQGWLSATFDSAVSAGTTVHVTDSSGKVLATFVTSKSMQNLVYSSTEIKSGTAYKIYTGGSASGADTGGLRASGSLGSATVLATVTAGQAPAGGGFGRR